MNAVRILKLFLADLITLAAIPVCAAVQPVARNHLVLTLLVFASLFHPLRSGAQSFVITNGVQTFTTLTNTTVTMSNRCELRITSTTAPLSGCTINLDSADSYLVLPGIKPSVAVSTYLGQMRINGAVAVADGNCRVVQYAMGAIVVPHAPSFQPLTVYSGPNFTGTSNSLSQWVNYTGNLGAMYRNISSFRLKRGYMATFAQNENGTGISKCYIAQDGDLEVSVLPANFDHTVRRVLVMPWRWTGKKGIAGDPGIGQLNVRWWYNWNISSSSSRDLEYVAIKQQPFWPSLNQNWQSLGINTALGYNEPNNPSQDAYNNLTPPGSVSDAVAKWPELLGTGLRIGSPAPDDGGRGSWLYPFMSQVEAAGLRVDFVAVHYYWCYDPANPSGAANQMYNFLLDVYNNTRRPIWITEWNNGANWTGCADPSYAQQQACIAAMINMLDNTPWVERYSLFSWVEEVRQVATNGVLTPSGVAYRDQQSPVGYLQALTDNGTRSFAKLRFENNALDSSGYGNNCVASGSPAYTNGYRGQAMVFDGTNTVVTLPPNIACSNSFTFAAWVYWNGGGAWQRVFDFGNSTAQNLFLTPSSGSGTLRFAIKNGGAEQIVETGALPANQWRHVAVTLSGNTARLYVNGVQVAVNSGMNITPASFNPRVNFLGKSQWPDPLFKGVMDEVLIADTAFSAAQIAALQTNSAPQFTNSVLTGTPVVQGQPYTGTIAGTATDPNGDTLSYGKATGPSWLNVAANGALSGTPNGNHAGTNYFTVRAADFAGNSAFATLAVVVQSPLTGGPALLARYAFDGNANDTSGNAFHGTATGSPLYVAGRFGSAVDLDGANHYVALPASLLTGVSNFTFAAWLNWDGGGAWQRIFDFGNNTTQYMFLSPSSGSSAMRFAITTNGGGAEQFLQTSPLPASQWQHVAFTRNANTGRLYVNGAQVASSAGVTLSPASFSPSQNYLGKSQWPDPLFNGRLDEVFVYNYALTGTEVVRLMNNQPPPPTVPATLSAWLAADALNLSWPSNYLGCRLESNSVSLTATGSWFEVSGSNLTNWMTLPVNPSHTNVFFRLVYP